MTKLPEKIRPLFEEHIQVLHDNEWVVELNRIIAKAMQLHATHFKNQHEECHIIYPGLQILFMLLSYGGKATQKQLWEKTGEKSQVISLTLRFLEKEGLVSRHMLQHDRRMRRVRLTDKGISLLQSAMPARKNYYSNFVKYISEDKARNLIAELKKVNKFYETELKKMKKTKSRGRRATSK